MQPRVRYVRTRDGVDIAYWAIGEGPVLVHGPLIPYSHIEMEWQIPELRQWYQRLAETSTVVRYDGRGTGSSGRVVDDVSLDGHVRDLVAVLETLGGPPASVMGVFHTVPAAVRVAVEWADLVADLVLWCGYARGADYWSATRSEGLRALRMADYDLFRTTAAHELFGWSAGEEAERYAELMGEAVDAAEADRIIAATREVDVSSVLGRVRCPTLVVHRRDLRWLDVSLSRGLAAGIPGARFAMIEGTSPLPGTGAVADGAAAIEEFLGRAATSMRRRGRGAGVRTILFTDLVGHSAMMSSLGDARGRDELRRHEAIVRDALAASDGHEVKALGDGFMASFASVADALECAVEIQRRFAGDDTLRVRVGIQSGEPIEEDGDLFGTAVILASRITAHAGPGEILVGAAVRELAAGKGFEFEDLGVFEAKGFDEPVPVWRVAWQDR